MTEEIEIIQEQDDNQGVERKGISLMSEGLYPREHKPDSAVRNLALAILLQALRDIIAPRRASNKERELWCEDALSWFSSDLYHPGSFTWVCDILEMNTEEIRTWIKEYKRSGKDRKHQMVKRLSRFQMHQN